MRSSEKLLMPQQPLQAARRCFLARSASALTAAALGASLAAATPARAAGLVVGSAAPPLTLISLDGDHIDSQSLKGKVVILTFWATWCEPCREELPLLSRFYERHRQDGLEVLGFSLDDASDMDDVKKVARTLQFPVGLLGSAYAGGYGRVWHLPVNFTIDRQGRLADNGWTDDSPVWTEERLNRVVLPLLQKA
jgi:cytochrome c biogenesis protein CcmG/thiol:disulfide interchange protein DsbE